MPFPFLRVGKESASHVLLMLHGWTSCAEDMRAGLPRTVWISLCNRLDLQVLLLNAHNAEWFSYDDPYSPSVEANISTREKKGLIRTRHILHHTIYNIRKRGRKVAIGGYSQGACAALDAGLSYSGQIAGVWASSGMVYENMLDEYSKPNRNSVPVTVYTYHGSRDRIIPYEIACRHYEELKTRGCADVRLEKNATNHWHFMQSLEFNHFVNALHNFF